MISPSRSRTSWPIGRSPARRGGCGRATPRSGLARDEGHWLDWLDITDDQVAHIGPLKEVAQEMANAGVSHAVLLGMGGSSLVSGGDAKDLRHDQGLSGTARAGLDRPRTDRRDRAGGGLDAHAVHRVEQVRHDTRTQHPAAVLLTRVKDTVGEAHACGHFIAITDPDSALHHLAERERFRQVFFGVPGIGGRYSALSNFGWSRRR